MPLIEVSALPQPEGVRERILDSLVAEVSAALGRPPGSVWAVWRPLEPGAYAVGEDRPLAQPRDTHPPIVRVHARRTPDEMERVVAAIERVIMRELALDPFVILEPAD